MILRFKGMHNSGGMVIWNQVKCWLFSGQEKSNEHLHQAGWTQHVIVLRGCYKKNLKTSSSVNNREVLAQKAFYIS